MVEAYGYNVHGSITKMPHLPSMRWNFKDQLSATWRQIVNDAPPPATTPETTYYVYDAMGQRVRKVTERRPGVRKNERLYVAGAEFYREYESGSVSLARETFRVMDDRHPIALIETKTIANGQAVAPTPVERYQCANHLGSTSLELNESGDVISFEEFSPFGTTTYQAGRSASDISLKRYRYTGRERDDETGLGYHGARYYASWLARWVSCDPLFIADGPNQYSYAQGDPILRRDTTGTTGVCDSDLTTCPEPTATVSTEQVKKRSSAADRAVDEVNDTNAVLRAATSQGETLPVEPVDIEQTLEGVDAALQRHHTARAVAAGVKVGRNEEEARQKEEAALEKELPGTLGAVTPIYGSTKSSIVHFRHGNVGRGVLYGALAISDVFLVKSLIVGGGKLILRGGGAALASESGRAVPGVLTAGVDGAEAAKLPAIVDADVLANVERGSANATTALRSVDPHITASQLREFLDVSTEVQRTQRAQLLLDEGVKPLSTSYGQLATPQVRDTFWQIARLRGTGDASLVIHGMQSGFPIVTADATLIRTLHQPLRVSGVHFILVWP
jgi:RHS repeat-associated protein